MSVRCESGRWRVSLSLIYCFPSSVSTRSDHDDSADRSPNRIMSPSAVSTPFARRPAGARCRRAPASCRSSRPGPRRRANCRTRKQREVGLRDGLAIVRQRQQAHPVLARRRRRRSSDEQPAALDDDRLARVEADGHGRFARCTVRRAPTRSGPTRHSRAAAGRPPRVRCRATRRLRARARPQEPRPLPPPGWRAKPRRPERQRVADRADARRAPLRCCARRGCSRRHPPRSRASPATPAPARSS